MIIQYIQYIKREDISYSEDVNLEKLNINVNAPDINEKTWQQKKNTVCSETSSKWVSYFLIKSFALVKSKINNVKLVIGGDSTLKHYLINLAKRLNLEKDVIFAGFVS